LVITPNGREPQIRVIRHIRSEPEIAGRPQAPPQHRPQTPLSQSSTPPFSENGIAEHEDFRNAWSDLVPCKGQQSIADFDFFCASHMSQWYPNHVVHLQPGNRVLCELGAGLVERNMIRAAPYKVPERLVGLWDAKVSCRPNLQRFSFLIIAAMSWLSGRKDGELVFYITGVDKHSHL
jgi:hypothetical protein